MQNNLTYVLILEIQELKIHRVPILCLGPELLLWRHFWSVYTEGVV